MYGIEIPKQRGIYSEILTTEDTENLRVSSLAASALVLTFFLLLNRKFHALALMNPLPAKSTRFKRNQGLWVSLI